MGLTTTQRFLLTASRTAEAGGYFAERAVGHANGCSPEASAEAMRSLGERKLVIPLANGQARLSPMGRLYAGQLEAKLKQQKPPARGPSRQA